MEDFFNASVCTVILLGERLITSFIVLLNESKESDSRPAIISVLIVLKLYDLTFSKAVKKSFFV